MRRLSPQRARAGETQPSVHAVALALEGEREPAAGPNHHRPPRAAAPHPAPRRARIRHPRRHTDLAPNTPRAVVTCARLAMTAAQNTKGAVRPFLLLPHLSVSGASIRRSFGGSVSWITLGVVFPYTIPLRIPSNRSTSSPAAAPRGSRSWRACARRSRRATGRRP